MAGLHSKGQVTMTETFDGFTFLPNGWKALESSTLWTRQITGSNPTCSPHKGNAMARFLCVGQTPGVFQTIATPAFDLRARGTGSAKVSLWVFRDNDLGVTKIDSISIYINTSLSLTGATHLGTVSRASKYSIPDTVGANGWYHYTFNIPAGMTAVNNYLLIKGISQEGNNIYIDDVTWDTYPANCSGKPEAGVITAANKILCTGAGNTTLTLSGYTAPDLGISYQWKWAANTNGPWTNFGTNSTTAATGTITVSRYYICVVTCSHSGLSDTTSLEKVTVKTNPNPVITISPNPANLCPGSPPLEMTASGNLKFTWSPASGLNRTDSSTVKGSPFVTTSYTVKGIDTAGCTGTITFNLNVRSNPIVSITSLDTNLCNGDSLKLNAQAGFGNTLVWTPGGQTTTSIIVKPLISTLYILVATSTFGCVGQGTKKIFAVGRPVADFSYTKLGNTIKFTNLSQNHISTQWDFGDGNMSNKSNPTYTFSDKGIFDVKLVIQNPPCSNDTIIKTIDLTTGINRSYSDGGLKIYPNPSKGNLNVSFTSTSSAVLRVTNMHGQINITRNYFAGKTNELIDISNLPKGVYTVSITSGSVTERSGLVLE